MCSSNYIIGECDEGLSNRLRVLLSLMHASHVLHNNSNIMMVWDVNDACPGHFLQLYQPIKKVTFITSATKSIFAPNATKVYPITSMGIRQFCETYDIKYRFKLDSQLWALLTPIQSIEDQVNDYVDRNNICSITAMHIRKTDLEDRLLAKRRTAIQKFFDWVESQPPAEPVYLLTDNPETQLLFLRKYGIEKIKVFKIFTQLDLQRPINDTTKLVLARKIQNSRNHSYNSSSSHLAPSHRYTTLEHTLIDALIASRSRKFRISAFSSLSEYIEFIRRLNRFKWCGRW